MSKKIEKAPTQPLSLMRPLRRFQCTFLPWSVRPPFRGPTKRQHWEEYPTEHFVEMDEASKVLLAEIEARAPDRNAAILDLGCNTGRHLNALHQRGYRNLRGVDWSAAAQRDMASRYPEAHAAVKLTRASFQEFLVEGAEQVDLAYSRGATFELVHPSFPLVRRVCAVVRRHVVLAIDETGHAYPRFWIYEFSREGFELRHLRRPASRLGQPTTSLLTFERIHG